MACGLIPMLAYLANMGTTNNNLFTLGPRSTILCHFLLPFEGLSELTELHVVCCGGGQRL